MYAFSSSGARRSLHTLVICSLAGAVILFSVSGADGVPSAWLFQLVALALATAGIYLLVGYALRAYRYEITDSGLIGVDGRPVYDLTVTMVTGRKMTVVTRVSLRDIGQVRCLTRAEYKKEQALRDIPHKFRYDNDPFAPVGCYITIPGEDALVIIPPDPGMTQILTDAAQRPGGEHPTHTSF